MNLSSIVVKRRMGNELTDVREFIRPDDFMVAQLVDSKATWNILEAWEWVLKNVTYPYAVAGSPDHHSYSAYGLASIPILGPFLGSRRYSVSDFWSFPAETLRDMVGDCEDSSFLLTSMLKRIDPTMQVFSTVGYFEEYGHVWTSILYNGEWLVLDTTLTEIPAAIPTETSRPEYKPLFRFNDKEIVIEDGEFVEMPELHAAGKAEAVGSAYQSWYSLVRSDYRIGV